MIAFTISGNHKNAHGNPVPKLKMTAGQRWTPKAQGYAKWKIYVGMQYARILPLKDRTESLTRIAKGVKPIALKTGQPARMDLKIFWKRGVNHGDPENIFGSIADALFVNDNNLNGSFEAHRAEDGKGRVEVNITI